MRYFFCILLLSLFISVPASWSAEGKDTLPMSRIGPGKIWDVADQRFISEKALLKKLERRRHVLIGTSPDNPAHSKRAAQILKDLVKAGRKPIVLLTNVERSKQNAFAIFLRRHQDPAKDFDATGLDMLLDWSHSGQADWAIAKPVFDMAMLKKLPIKAVNFSRYEVGQLHHSGLGGLPDDVKQKLMPLLSPPLPNNMKARLTGAIDKAYCGKLPPEILEKFIMIRRARDGLFALAITQLSAGPGAKSTVLIAPREHIRKDIGIPRYLDKMGGAGTVASLSFVETKPAASLPREKEATVDFIWFTDKVSRPDPCGLLKR